MPKFKLVASWREYSTCEIEAESLEQAIEIANERPDDFTPEILNDWWDDGDWHIVEHLCEEIKHRREAKPKKREAGGMYQQPPEDWHD